MYIERLRASGSMDPSQYYPGFENSFTRHARGRLTSRKIRVKDNHFFSNLHASKV